MEDGYHDSYNGAPTNGGVWQGDGAKRVLRGESLDLDPQYARTAKRIKYGHADRYDEFSFRVARMLP